jgi:hypothetical protein
MNNENNGWKPIETAPKGVDGYASMQLAWGPDGDKGTGEGMRAGDKFYAAVMVHCWGKRKEYELRIMEVKPTHWQEPLAPPNP